MKLSTFFFFVLFFCVGHSFGQIFPVTKSAIAEGDVYKLGIAKNGVYKVTKKMLDDLGINTATLDPTQIKLLGNFGGTLPEAIALSYPDDLIEFPVFVSGESDGKFNDADYIFILCRRSR